MSINILLIGSKSLTRILFIVKKFQLLSLVAETFTDWKIYLLETVLTEILALDMKFIACIRVRLSSPWRVKHLRHAIFNTYKLLLLIFDFVRFLYV